MTLELKLLPKPLFEKVPNFANRDRPLYGTRIPKFNIAFHEILQIKKKIPDQQSYATFWILKAHEEGFFDGIDGYLKERGLSLIDFVMGFRKRACRNYPSFVRELYLYRLLIDFVEPKIDNKKFIYDIDWDSKGYDFVCIDKESEEPLFGIKSFLDSRLSNVMLEYKKQYRSKNILPYIELPVCPDNCFNLNDFYLNKKADMHSVVEFINEGVFDDIRRES